VDDEGHDEVKFEGHEMKGNGDEGVDTEGDMVEVEGN